jgi:hypothetical protein
MQAFRAVQFHCAQCNEGPFESPEELGTHSAFCYPGAALKGPPRPAPEETEKSGGGRLDALAASINAIRMAKGGSGNLYGGHVAQPQLPNSDPLLGVEEVEELDDDAILLNEADPSGEPIAEEDDDLDSQLERLDLSAAPGFDEGRPPVCCEDDEALTTALLSTYQAAWDDNQVDCDLIFELLKYVFSSAFGQQGSVLVFLPGWDDISTLHRMLSGSAEFSNVNKFMLLQLHSGIQKKEQEMVFHSLRPGQHKIILSTNIAETSITIDDVTVVINAGRAKEKTYDPHTKLGYLQTSWISQASARQVPIYTYKTVFFCSF